MIITASITIFVVGFYILYRRRLTEIKNDYMGRRALPPSLDIVSQIALRTWCFPGVAANYTLDEWVDKTAAACMWRRGHCAVRQFLQDGESLDSMLIRIPNALTFKWSRKRRKVVPVFRFPAPKYSKAVTAYNLRKWMFTTNVDNIQIYSPSEIAVDESGRNVIVDGGEEE